MAAVARNFIWISSLDISGFFMTDLKSACIQVARMGRPEQDAGGAVQNKEKLKMDVLNICLVKTST